MSNLYLTIGKVDVPRMEKIHAENLLKLDDTPEDEFGELFFSIPEQYKEFRTGLLELIAQQEAIEAPVYKRISSDVTLEMIKELDMDLKSLKYLFYCHETLEKVYLLPALKIKRKFEWNDCIPLMVSQSGSLSSLNAISLAQVSLNNELAEQALMIIADRVEFAELRYQFTGYLRGDSASAIKLSTAAGDYQILEVQKVNEGIPLSYPLWQTKDYKHAEQLLIDRAVKLLQLAHSTYEKLDFIVCPHLSDAFCSTIELSSQQLGVEFYVREQWKNVNLLSNDPYVSLQHLEKERELYEGDKIVLLFASIDFGAGYLILQKS